MKFIRKLTFLKRNRKDFINIWMKKSSVKFDKKKTTLLEFITPTESFYLFLDRSAYSKIKSGVHFYEVSNNKKITDLKNKIIQDGFYFLNGKKIELDIN